MTVNRLFCWPLLFVAAVCAPGAADETGSSDPFKKAAQRWMDRLDSQYGEGFWRYYCDDGVMPRPYLVAAQHSEGVDPETQEKDYAGILSNLYQIFFEQYGDLLELKHIDQPVPVLVFGSKKSYEKVREDNPKLGLADPEFIAGYYMPATGVLYQWDQPNLRDVMFHEGTHQLVDFGAKQHGTPQQNESAWFQEGIADYLGGHKRNTDYSEELGGFVTTYELGQFLPNRYSALQRGLQNGDAFSLKELTEMTFLEFIAIREGQKGSSANQVKTNMVYCQGWGLVMFMHQAADGAYRPMLDEFFQAEIRGEGGGTTFADMFGVVTDEDWEMLEQEFREFVFTDLRQMRYKK